MKREWINSFFTALIFSVFFLLMLILLEFIYKTDVLPEKLSTWEYFMIIILTVVTFSQFIPKESIYFTGMGFPLWAIAGIVYALFFSGILIYVHNKFEVGVLLVFGFGTIERMVFYFGNIRLGLKKYLS